MKSTSTLGKQSTSSSASSSGTSKSKKSSKDREKRKSQTTTENSNQHNTTDKGSPNKDGNTRKYAGYGPEQISFMAEQSIFEHLNEEVCVAFTEDINYKIRHVIYDALEKARLSGRNYIAATDVDDTFECLQIEPVYGTLFGSILTSTGDLVVEDVDDAKVNLIELAEEPSIFSQAGDAIVTRKWLPETKEVNKNLKLYFVLMCQAVVDKNQELRLTALGDISSNYLIGPIVEWFYHFGYFLLSKDITYDSLTLCAFDLIEALEYNPITSHIISEKQIMLLARLLSQRLLRLVTTPEVLKPMCRVLAILCKRIPPRKMILKKIVSKFPEIKDDFALPVICLVNELGLDAIYAILLPHLEYLFGLIEDVNETELACEILTSYNILCLEGKNFPAICDVFYDTFGDGIVAFWRSNVLPAKDISRKESNWNIKSELLKTRRKIAPNPKTKIKKIHIEEAFPDDTESTCDYDLQVSGVENNLDNFKSKISFKFNSFVPATGRLRFLNLRKYQSQRSIEDFVVIGKRTLLIPVLKSSRNNLNVCTDHSMMSYNL